MYKHYRMSAEGTLVEINENRGCLKWVKNAALSIPGDGDYQHPGRDPNSDLDNLDKGGGSRLNAVALESLADLDAESRKDEQVEITRLQVQASIQPDALNHDVECLGSTLKRPVAFQYEVGPMNLDLRILTR